MCVDARAAVPSRPGAGAACDGLIVAEGLVPKREVVHATLGGGARSKCLEYDINHPLRGEDIAADHGGGWRGVEQAAFGDAERDGSEAALRSWGGCESLEGRRERGSRDGAALPPRARA
eukprot:scaffold1378_cov24-Tisochrysis_lutea.AAC.2